MRVLRSASLITVSSVVLAFVVGCEGPTEPPAPGAIMVTIVATGADIRHPDSGYRAVVDGGTTFRMDSLRRIFTAIAPGEHAIRLDGVAANCSVTGQNPITVTVESNATALAHFTVNCVPHVGTVRVTTSTTGGQSDPNGYWVLVDGVYREQIDPNATVAISDVRAGLHAISLADVAPNCGIAAPHPINVLVGFQDTFDVHFNLTCAVPGDLEVAVATTGVGVDANGYTVAVAAPSVSFAESQSVAPNGSVTFSSLVPAADYRVVLQGVAANCDIAGTDTRTVTVAAGGTTRVVFDVSCELATPLAVVRNDDIYLISSDGTGASPLTTEPGFDGDPAWSSTGRIAFTTNRHSSDLELYVVNVDGTNLLRLTTSFGADDSPSWSPDGMKIVFRSFRDVNSEIYVVNADGTGLTRLTNNTANDFQPAWSSTGRIVFVSDRDHPAGEVYVMNADGSNVIRLTTNDFVESGPAWSPDASMIAFAREISCGYYYCIQELFVMNADGSNEKQLTTSGIDYNSDPAWSPNGRAIAFTSQHCPYYCDAPAVWLADLQGTQRAQITDNAANPAWRP